MPAKIALVTPGYQSSPDDWCIPVFTNLAHELAKSVELHVFALRYPARRDSYRIGNVVVHSLGGGKWAGRRIPAFSLGNLWRTFLVEVEREHRLSPFSAVVGLWATESGWLATRAASRLRLKSLIHVAGGELVYIPQINYGNRGKGLSGWLVDNTLRSADMLTVPSLPMRQAITKLVDPARVRNWAPGVDTDLFAPPARAQITPGSYVFVTAGSLIPVKGHELLLRALAVLHDNETKHDLRLRIIGDGPLRPYLQRLAADLQLMGYVAFEGEVSHDTLPGIFAGCDAFLLGSWHESQCMAALEAMACGLPCVAPPVGALAGLAAANGARGPVFLFTERAPEQVAEVMAALVELRVAEREAQARQAREAVLANYELSRQSARFLGLIDELTSS